MREPGISSVPHSLGPGVELFCIDLDAYAARSTLTGLQAEEYAAAQRRTVPGEAQRFLASRHALKRLLAEALQFPPEAVELAADRHGKPRITGHDLHFNLSHSGPLALVGLTRQGPIGVDVELVRPIPDAVGLIREHFTRREQEEWAARPPSGRDSAFLTCWTRKEAWAKALGRGIAMGMNTIDVGCLPTHYSSPEARGEQMTVCSVAPAAGAVGAVARLIGDTATTS